MFCNHCGQEIPENNRFCQNCGAPVTPAYAPTEADPNFQQPQDTLQYAAYPPVYPAAPVDPGASTGTAAFVLGLVGLIVGAICSCGCAILGGFLPLIACILAIVFGYQAKQKSAQVGLQNSRAQTGLILGIIGIAVILIFIIINAILGATMGASGVYDYWV